MSFGPPPTPQAVALPQQPAIPPLFGQAAQPGSKPKPKPSQPTFLGAGLTAGPQNRSFKTLLGGSGAGANLGGSVAA